MNTIVKGILLTVATPVVLAGVTLAMAPKVIESGWGQSRIADQLSQALGQELSFTDLDVDVGRVLRIRLVAPEIDNPAWAESPHLAQADEIALSVEALPLLVGRMSILEATIEAPRVHLERSREGRTTWEPFSRETQSSGGLKLVRIDNVSVSDARLDYLDPARATDLRFMLGARSVRSGASLEMDARGGGRLLGEPATARLSAAALLALGPGKTRYPLELAIVSGDARMSVTGEIARTEASSESGGALDAQLALSIEGDSLARLNRLADTRFEQGDYALSARLVVNEAADDGWVWRVDELVAHAGNSDLSGALTVRQTAPGLTLDAALHSRTLDLAQLAHARPADPQAADNRSGRGTWRRTGIPASLVRTLVARDHVGTMRYRADSVLTPVGTLHAAGLEAHVSDGALELRDVRARIGAGEMTGRARLMARTEPASGNVRVELSNFQAQHLIDRFTTAPDEPQQDSAPRARAPLADTKGIVNGQLEFDFSATVPGSDSAADGGVLRVETLDLKELRIALQGAVGADGSEPQATNLVAGIEPVSADSPMNLLLKGDIRDAPLTLRAALPALDTLFAAPGSSPLPVSVALGILDTTVEVTGTASVAWPLRHVDVQVAVRSPKPSATAAVFGVDLPEMGPLSADASFTKTGEDWRLSNLESVLGASDLRGEVAFIASEQPQLKAKLRSSQVAFHAPPAGAPTTSPALPPAVPATPALPQFSWAADVDGSLSWRMDTVLAAGTRFDDVAVEARLADAILQIRPSTFRHAGGTAEVGLRLDLSAPGLTGTLEASARELDATQLFGTGASPSDRDDAASGDETRSVAGSVSGHLALRLLPATASRPTPVFDRLRIDSLRGTYDDPDRRTRSDLHLVADSMTAPVQVDGTVELRDVAVNIELITGSVRDALRNPRTLPVDATLRLADTRVRLESRVDRLLPLETLSATVTVSGPDPARLGEALALPLPSLPPYRLHAEASRNVDGALQRWKFDALDGRVGDSDLSGRLHVTFGGDRPSVFARLWSSHLDLDDLAGLIGAPPDPEETASPRQRARAERLERAPTVLPSKPVRSEKLRIVDADVQLRATRVDSPRLPVDDLAFDLTLEDGNLTVSRLDFGAAGGSVVLTLEADARQTPLSARLTGDIDRVRLSEIVEDNPVARDSFGVIGGRVALWMRGDSPATWLASADGGMYLTMTGGTIDGLLVELAGLDIVESTAVLLGTDAHVEIECAYADLQARSGQFRVSPLLIDTVDTRFEGSGTIDLRDESLDLVLKPYPKDFSLISLRGPLDVKGTLKNPEFEVNPGFPTPELGLAKDAARCRGLIEALREARKS